MHSLDLDPLGSIDTQTMLGWIFHVHLNQTAKRSQPGLLGWMQSKESTQRCISTTWTRNLLFRSQESGSKFISEVIDLPQKNPCLQHSIFQRFRNSAGRACRAEHFWLVEYSQHFISPAMFKSLQLQAHSLLLHCASRLLFWSIVLQDGVTEESVRQMDRWRGAGLAEHLRRRRYPAGQSV